MALRAARIRNLVGCLIGTAWLANAVYAQEPYPNRPIRIVVPFAAGSSVDALARSIGQRLGESVGQPVVVDVRPGAGSVIGTASIVGAKPDGYTLLMMNSAHVMLPHLNAKLPYDALRDFTPIASVTVSELVFALHPSVPANSLKEFIALAKSRPGQLNYSTSGAGSVTHVITELFDMQAGIQMQDVPYGGAGPAVTALLGGQVQVSIQPPITTLAHIKAGTLKALAITGSSRFPALPDVPTFAEAGMPGYDVKVWYGIVAPAGTPKPIVDKLSSELTKIMETPEFVENLAAQGMKPFVATGDKFGALMRSELEVYGKVIKSAGIKLGN